MAGVTAYQHGIYPRSEPLVAATRDLDRGRTSPEAVEALRERDLQELVQVQREAGLDLICDGLLRWQDLFRPLVEACPGLRPGPLVRWFDNNTFFRAPEVVGELGIDVLPDALAADDGVPGPRVATLPSPYLFSRAAVVAAGSAGGGAAVDRNQLMVELARGVLRPVAERLVAAGHELVQLQEPWLAFHGIEDGDWKHLEEAVGAVAEGLGATVVLHTFFGDAAPHAERLRDLPVDAVGFDFAETDLARLGSGWSRGVLVGALNGRRSLVESAEDVAALVRAVGDALEPPALYVSSASDLELLPRDLAERKVRLLGEAAALLRGPA